LGQLVGAGALNESEVARSLLAIAMAIGLSEKEAQHTIQSGIASGIQQPRDVPEPNHQPLPPLPDADTLEKKYNELKSASKQNQANRFREMSGLLASADPFTAEFYVDKIASDKIATKTVARQAIKDSGKKQKKQQRPNPTHDELGDRWIAQHSGLTVFVYEKWYRYKNGIWKPTDKVDSEVWDILIFAKSEGVRPTKNIKISVLDYMQNQCRKADETMNSSPHLVCMQNGVFDLEKLELIDYDPTHYMTSKLEFNYDPAAECPLWQETILDWMSGNESGIKHLQEAIGYSLTSDTKYQMAWMLAGEGSNGKDTLLEILRCLVGDAHHELDLSALSVDERYGLANLPGKKVVTCAEAVSDRPVADTYFKKLISGEPMEARAPYGKPFNFRPICKIWWSVNDKPLVTDQTKGYWRRWTVVPFLESYLGREDFDLEDKLKKELPGIFNWAVEGLKRLRKSDRLTLVPEFVDATQEYRHKTSVESIFVEEACIIDLQAESAIKTVYAAYKAYCIENGYRAKGKRRFTDDMVRLGYERGRMSGGTRCLRGLTVKAQVQWD
jgi:putative DNA primase/helicase